MENEIKLHFVRNTFSEKNGINLKFVLVIVSKKFIVLDIMIIKGLKRYYLSYRSFL